MKASDYIIGTRPLARLCGCSGVLTVTQTERTRSTTVIESVPNVSEGRRTSVLDDLTQTLRQVPRLVLLDRSADPAHNRSVFTYAGDAVTLEAASLALIAAAISRVDLNAHRGVHPRMGAVDVVPFIPLEGSTMEDCCALARRVGSAVASRFEVPVFLYAAAASRPERQRLEDIRRGEFEGLSSKLQAAAWTPDFGPSRPHPTAGAIAIGARPALIAFNVNLETDRLDVARQIAAALRERGGGLPGVKALGLPLADRGIVQISMNLVDYTRTPPIAAFEAVCREAHKRGINVRESELVGLIPRAALEHTTAEALRLRHFSVDQILEERLARSVANP